LRAIDAKKTRAQVHADCVERAANLTDAAVGHSDRWLQKLALELGSGQSEVRALASGAVRSFALPRGALCPPVQRKQHT